MKLSTGLKPIELNSSESRPLLVRLKIGAISTGSVSISYNEKVLEFPKVAKL